MTSKTDVYWDDPRHLINVPAPSVLWLADPPRPPHLAKPPVRVVLPRFMTIATEVSLDKKGRLVLGKITSAAVERRKLLEPIDDRTRSSYPSKCRASTIIKSYISCRHEYRKPFASSFIVEERRKGRGMRHPSMIPGVQMSLLYTEAPDDQHRRVAQGFTEKLKTLPIFEFPEIIMNSRDIKNDNDNLVFAADKTKKLLEHLILRVDVNDNLLSDLSCLLTLPSEREFQAKAKVNGRELVQSHLNHGRWVWVTRHYRKTSLRNVLACQSADLMDARLAYWQWGDDPRRLEIIRTVIKGYPLDCGKYATMKKDLGINSMTPGLDSYFHHITTMTLEDILDIERLGWANLGGPTALTKEVAWQMSKSYGTSDENTTGKQMWLFWFFLNAWKVLIGQKIDKGKKREVVITDDIPWTGDDWYVSTTRPTATEHTPKPFIPRRPTGFGTKQQICWCGKSCASGSGTDPNHVLQETSSDDTKPGEVSNAKQSKAGLSGTKGVQGATMEPVVKPPSIPVTTAPSKLRNALRRANRRVVSSASRVPGSFGQFRESINNVSLTLPVLKMSSRRN